jgi:cell division septum initiation protein DivIVA
MFRRADAVLVVDESGMDVHRPLPVPAELVHRPDVAGALDGLLSTAPCFRTAVRGYDRVQVDNYVAWAETEIASARRETDDLMSRYGHASAELEISRRLLTQSPGGQEMTFVSERMGRMLQMAADEASEITGSAAADADRIQAEARADADARLRKAHEIKQMAVRTADQIREDADRLHAEAAAELERAREQAAQYLRDAAAQVWREQQAAAAAASAQVAQLQEEVQELRWRREQAQDHLRRLIDQVGEALDALAGNQPSGLPTDPRGDLRSDVRTDARGDLEPNFVVDRSPVHS